MRFALISRRPCNDYPRVRHRTSNRFLKRKKFTRAQARRSNLRRKKKAILMRQENGIMFNARLSMKVREGSVGLPMVPKASLPPQNVACARLHPPLSAQAAAPCTHFSKTENRKRREGLAIAAIRRQHERRERTAARAFNSWGKITQEKAIKARSKPGDQSPQARHEKDKCTEEMLRYTAM